MYRLLQLIVSLLFFIPLAWSQPNLVPNPSFENKKKCLKTSENYNLDSLNNVEKWFSLIPYWNLKYWGGIWQSGKCVGIGCIWGGGIWGGGVWGGGYFNRCIIIDSPPYKIGVPQNSDGYQEPKTGDAYISLNLYQFLLKEKTDPIFPAAVFSEYASVKLNSTCINRLNYFGKFYTNACGLSGDNILPTALASDTFGFRTYTTSSLGMYLCNQVPKLQNNRRLEVKAQINNDPNRNLNDTVNWMEISGSFEANGTEQYLILGSFNDSADIKYFNSFGYKEPWLNQFGVDASYYIDDVSLIPQNTTHFYDTLLCSNAPLQLGAVAQADSFEWNDGNKTDKLRNFTTAGLVWVKSWLYGGTVYMWDSLNIIPNNINSGLPKDTFMCNEQTQLNLTSTNPNTNATYLWNDGSKGKSLLVNRANLVNGKTKVWLTTTANYCIQTDTVTITQMPAIQIPITDTTTCFEDVPQILLDAGATFKSYLWQPTGETSKTVYSNQAQIYNLTVTDSFNCSATKSVIVDELCKAEIFIPNAFTPNNDNINDGFKPVLKTKNLIQYELKIYDSWGNEVFTTTNPNQAWEAKSNQQGVYVVTVNYQYKGFVPNSVKGTVTLLR
jgi:gliding motility-associated-like protein